MPVWKVQISLLSVCLTVFNSKFFSWTSSLTNYEIDTKLYTFNTLLLTYLLLFIKHYDTVQLNSTKYPQFNNQAVIAQVQYMHRLCALDSVIT